MFVCLFWFLKVLVNNQAISRTGPKSRPAGGFVCLFVCFGFLKSSSTTRLYRGPVPSLGQLEGLFVCFGFLTSSSTTGLYRGPVPSLGQLEGLFVCFGFLTSSLTTGLYRWRLKRPQRRTSFASERSRRCWSDELYLWGRRLNTTILYPISSYLAMFYVVFL